MIRPLNSYGEIVGVIDLMEEAFSRSKWALTPGAAVDRIEARRRLTNANQRMGKMSEGGTFFEIAENRGHLTGFMVGQIDRVYGVGNLLQASDIYLYSQGAESGADPMDWMRMVKAYIDWAKSVKGIAQIVLQQYEFIAGEPIEHIRRYYGHLDFKEVGSIHEWRAA